MPPLPHTHWGIVVNNMLPTTMPRVLLHISISKRFGASQEVAVEMAGSSPTAMRTPQTRLTPSEGDV